MGSFSMIHWVIIALIVFLLFGNRLPSVMRSLGQGVVEFKKGLQGIEDEVKGSTGKIEEQPNKPPVAEQAKQSQGEPVQR
jgi:sec-independent protein translocase protein TatA